MAVRLTSMVEGKNVAIDLTDGTYSIGGEGSDIEVADPALVGPYAELSVSGGSARIRDLGSEAGVYVSGYRIFGSIPRDLANGDAIQVGESSIVVEAEAKEAPRAVRLVLTQAGRELALDLGVGTYVVGRSDAADIVVPDPAIAQRHLEVSIAEDGVTVRPLEASEKTRLNRSTLSGGIVSPFKPGDRLELSRESVLSVEIAGVPVSNESLPQKSRGVTTDQPLPRVSGGGFDIAWWLFSFTGRIGRARWWLGQFLSIVVLLLPLFPMAFFLSRGSNSFVMFAVAVFVLSLPVCWASFALSAKRFHDLGMSGWLSTIGLIPFLGGLVLTVMCGFLPGNPGPNAYGSQADSRV